jgi:hypothetical protein
MPYISKSKRKQALKQPVTKGDLNYCITMELLAYLKRQGEKYDNYADIHSVLVDPFKLKSSVKIDKPKNVDELNRKVHYLVNIYLEKSRTPFYEDDLKGVFSTLDKEFYARMTRLYENEKIKDNGDLFPRDLESQVIDDTISVVISDLAQVRDEISILKEEIEDLKKNKKDKRRNDG